jgi:hypothetical protein
MARSLSTFLAASPPRYQAGQVAPREIVCFNEPNFPIPLPFLRLLLAGDCLDGDLKRLDVHETVHVVFPGEPRPFRCCSSRAK